MKKSIRNIEIYFHIGVERTGTKYLQKSIFPNYEGIHFINKNQYSKAIEIIAKKKHKRYLVSMELNLSPQFEKEVKYFSNVFPNTKVIMVLRSHEKWLVSHYKRIVKNGEKKTFKQFLDLDSEKSVYKIADLYYMDKIRILEKHFKPEPLYLLYEDLRVNPLNYLKRLANYIGIEFDSNLVDFNRRHASYTDNQLKAIQSTRKFINIDRKKPFNNVILNFAHRISVDLIRYTVLYISKVLPDSFFRSTPFIELSEIERVKKFYQDDWIKAVQYVRSKE